MTPNYGEMARGMRDLGMATLRTEARLLERWIGLVQRSSEEFSEGLKERKRDGSLIGACGNAARTYLRGAAALPELAMMDLVTELDAVRKSRAKSEEPR